MIEIVEIVTDKKTGERYYNAIKKISGRIIWKDAIIQRDNFQTVITSAELYTFERLQKCQIVRYDDRVLEIVLGREYQAGKKHYSLMEKPK